MAKTPKKERQPIMLFAADPNNTPLGELSKNEGPPTLVKSILNVLNGPGDSIERLAFEVDPSSNNSYQAVYKAKTKLIPDQYLKRIAIQDDLVASILNARSNQLGSFGREARDRFSTGFKIEIHPEIEDSLKDDEKKEVQEKIKDVARRFLTCGSTKGFDDHEELSLSQFLFIMTRNGLTCGRWAVEAIYTDSLDSDKKKFHSFRPIDAGTIFRATPQTPAQDTVRQEAKHLLEQLKDKKFDSERFVNNEYSWVQVFEGRPFQVFTSQECLVHNLYPVADIEMDGYPITPLDTVISAVTTHINITTHNKLYFQNGRATRGMLVINSDDITDEISNQMRQHFNANINNVNNSWRMPVFGVGSTDKITWQAIDTSSRDMEFQYLSDNNARVILSAFQMSPEELPGYAHLSRGTNNQALSESNQEYKMEAHRDLGIRPLVAHWEDFLNARIFPLLDPELSKIASIKLVGLDADTPEKESVRLGQDAPLHMTYDEILQKVGKKPMGAEWAGGFPFNPQWQAILDKYFYVGEIIAYFFKKPEAAQDPALKYMRDQFFFSFAQMQMQKEQLKAQQQAQQQQAQQQQAQAQAQQGQAQQQQQGEQGEVANKADEAKEALGKSERQLEPGKRRIVTQQERLVGHVMDSWKKESKKTLAEIISLASRHVSSHHKE